MSAPAEARPCNPLAAIHAFCVQCSGGSYREIWYCKIESCPLWDYRQKPPAPRREKTFAQLRITDLIEEVET